MIAMLDWLATVDPARVTVAGGAAAVVMIAAMVLTAPPRLLCNPDRVLELLVAAVAMGFLIVAAAYETAWQVGFLME